MPPEGIQRYRSLCDDVKEHSISSLSPLIAQGLPLHKSTNFNTCRLFETISTIHMLRLYRQTITMRFRVKLCEIKFGLSGGESLGKTIRSFSIRTCNTLFSNPVHCRLCSCLFVRQFSYVIKII